MINRRVPRHANRPRRCHDAWAAATEQRLPIHQVRIDVVRRCRARRRHMIEESAPLIVIQHQYRAAPLRAVDNGFVYLRDERIAVANIRFRVIVVGCVEQQCEARVHKRYGGQRTRRTVGEKGRGRVAKEERIDREER